MSRSVVALLLATSLLTSACATKTQRRVATTTLAVASAAAIVTGIGTHVEADCGYDAYQSCDTEGTMRAFANMFLVAGAVLAVGAYAIHRAGPHDPEPAPPPEVERDVAPVAATATIELPARTTDERTRQLASQAARAAAYGQCTAARVTLEQVAERDAAYHAELRGLDVFARCI